MGCTPAPTRPTSPSSCRRYPSRGRCQTGHPSPPRLQAAADALVAEPPRGQQVQLDGDRLTLMTAAAVGAAVERLLTRLRRGVVLEPLDLPETVWLVLAIVVLEQPITRAEITAR